MDNLYRNFFKFSVLLWSIYFYLRNRYIAENKVSKKLYILVVLSVNALTERKESAG